MPILVEGILSHAWSGDCHSMNVHCIRNEHSVDIFVMLLLYGVQLCLCMSRTRTSLVDRSLTVAGPGIWNKLPLHLRDSQLTFLELRRLLTTASMRVAAAGATDGVTHRRSSG